MPLLCKQGIIGNHPCSLQAFHAHIGRHTEHVRVKAQTAHAGLQSLAGLGSMEVQTKR